MTTTLEAHSVSVRIGAKSLIADVSLLFTAGETVALVGPNGAGKSTLLRVLSGELKPTSGHVTLKGRPLAEYPPRMLARHRAVLSQSTHVTFPFTVADIAEMGAGDSHPRNLAALVDSALADVDLGDLRDRLITTLSGGEQQRAHFARVLVQLGCGEEAIGPGVLLLDEPTANLDLRHQLDLLRIAAGRAARGATVIAIVHDLNLAAMFADRVVVLRRGHVVADGSPAATITETTLATVFDVTGAVSQVPASGLPFVLPHEANRQRA